MPEDQKPPILYFKMQRNTDNTNKKKKVLDLFWIKSNSLCLDMENHLIIIQRRQRSGSDAAIM